MREEEIERRVRYLRENPDRIDDYDEKMASRCVLMTYLGIMAALAYAVIGIKTLIDEQDPPMGICAVVVATAIALPLIVLSFVGRTSYTHRIIVERARE